LQSSYNPEKFPGAEVLPYYEKYFGSINSRTEVCSFGFEPNPEHVKSLKQLEKRLATKSYNALIFTETAVGIENGNVTFYVDATKTGKNNKAWGSSRINWKPDQMISIKAGLIDFGSFVKHEIFTRAGQTEESKIFMKMDIEGSEYELLPVLVKEGVLCGIDAIVVEFHRYFVKGAEGPKYYIPKMQAQLKQQANCKAQILSLDDESYRNVVE
jgi:FkbM family methyltransferase